MAEIQAYGFSPDGFSQIIVFSSENDLREAITANPQMTGIMGADSYTKENFPNVFLAGVRANSQADKAQECSSSTQKQYE